jgi:hypothetical protein
MMIFHNSTLLGICQSRCTYLYGTGEAPFASCTLRHCLDRNRWRQIYNVHFASRDKVRGLIFVLLGEEASLTLHLCLVLCKSKFVHFASRQNFDGGGS